VISESLTPTGKQETRAVFTSYQEYVIQGLTDKEWFPLFFPDTFFAPIVVEYKHK